MKLFASIVILAALIGTFPVQAYCQSGSPGGHEIVGICGDDVLCHFENEYCGTSHGTVSFCTGAWGYGISTEGGGYVDLGDDDRFSVQIIEIECQVIFTHLPQDGDHAAGLVTKYVNGDPGASEWGLFVEGNLRSPSWALLSSGSNGIYSNAGVEANVLYSVRAWLCRNGYGEIWVNGQRVASGNLNINNANTTTPVIIGNSSSGQNYFHGMIDEVRIGCTNTISTRQMTWGGIKTLYE